MLFLSMYTFIILTMRLCAQRNSCPKRTEWSEDLIHTHTHTLPPYIQPSSRPTLRGDASAAERIHKLKKRAARVITESPHRTPSTALFEQLRWLSLPDRIKYRKAYSNQWRAWLRTIYVRTFRISTNGLIAKHTFKCQRWPIRTTSPDTVAP